MLLFGIINFGVIFAQNLALNNGAREAARFGAVRGHVCDGADGIKQQAKDASTSLGMSSSAVTATVTPPSGGSCGHADGPCAGTADPNASVKVVTTFSAPIWVPLPGIPSTFSLEGHGEFRCEYS